jgi:hypothetical protein
MPIEKIIVWRTTRSSAKVSNNNCAIVADVASASTIAAARELLTKDNFGLMIVDVTAGDGTELLKQLASPHQAAGGDSVSARWILPSSA